MERTIALDRVSLEVKSGTSLAIMGPSGCGKSTLLRLLGLLMTPTTGTVSLLGAPAPPGAAARARLRNSTIGFVHQDVAVIDSLNVSKNIPIPLEYADPPVRRRERARRSALMAEQTGMDWAMRVKAGALSGGERQRVAVARALIADPRLVLADEPTSALDAANAQTVLDLLLGLCAQGRAVVLSTHDPRIADQCDRVVHLLDGRIETFTDRIT